MSDYPKSEGVLFSNNQKKTEKHPDFRGHIVVTGEQIKKLIEMHESGNEMRLQVAVWDRTAKASGNPYKYIATEAYIKQEKQAPAAPSDIPF